MLRRWCGRILPMFVFLCETRQKSSKMKRIRGHLGLHGFLGVDSNGLSGGLALFCHESYQVTVLGTDDRFIDISVSSPGGEQWRLTAVYSEPMVENMHLMWTKLQTLKQASDLPWVVIRDFNEAM